MKNNTAKAMSYLSRLGAAKKMSQLSLMKLAKKMDTTFIQSSEQMGLTSKKEPRQKQPDCNRGPQVVWISVIVAMRPQKKAPTS